jgi:hypothetical protein
VAIVVLGVAACGSPAHGQSVADDATVAPAPTFPESVTISFGGSPCRGFPVPNGLAFAAHCRRLGVPIWQNTNRPWSLDPAGRDIGHIVVRGVTATLGTALPGDRLWWRNDRGAGRVRIIRETTGYNTPGAWYHDRPGQRMIVACVDDGDRFWRGYSGTGLYNCDGNPTAMFVGGWLGEHIPYDNDCGRDQMVLAVPIP